MKIGIISRGRTTSSAILQSLANTYNLNNYGEYYFSALKSSRHVNTFKEKLIKNKHIDRFKNFEDIFLNKTKKLFQNESFICKLWPSMLLYRENYDDEITPDYAKNNILYNITKVWNLGAYDKLYFLDRDVKLSTYSWVYSKKLNFFHVKKNHPCIVYNKITLTKKDINVSKLHILEYCLQQRIKDYINCSNLNVIQIHDVSNFVNQNKVDTINSNINYKELITNINEIENLFGEYLKKCLYITKDWTFY